VDVLNGTGDDAVAGEVAVHLAAAGLTVGTVTHAGSTASGIEYPTAEQSPAQWLGEALHAAAPLRTSDVPRVTVVLGAGDSAALVQAIAALPACG
jgi:hypothetical protein